MKNLRSVFVFFAALSFSTIVMAADPSGAWKWSVTPPNGDAIEISLKLELKDGKLTGIYSSPFGDGPISKASVKDDALVFEVEREMDGNKFVVKYAGKIIGDAIKGTIEVPAFDGAGSPAKQEWNAKRVK